MSYPSKKQSSLLSFSFQKSDNPRYFYALCAIKFLLSVTFTLFKNQKISNVVLKSGAECIPSIKLFVFFVAIFAAYVYTALSNRLSYQQLAYCILGFFFGSFFLYAFVLYPRLDALKPDITQLPASYQAYTVVKLYGDWPIVLFFSLAELLGQFCIVVFFWGVANDIYNKKQAKRFYQWFIASGCLGGVVGSLLARRIIRLAKTRLSNIVVSKAKMDRILLEKSSQMISIHALIFITGVAWLYTYLRSHIPPSKISVEEQRKKKPSFKESIRFIYTNPYLVALSVMIISCGISMNIVQVTYKKYLGLSAGYDVVTYVDYEANAGLLINFICIFACFFITPFLAQNLSWKRFAMLSPILIFAFGAAFFTASTFKHWGWLPFVSNQLKFVTWIAWIDSVGATCAKYVLFDNAKEQAWLGVDNNTKKQGKASVDVVSSRTGKAISSVFHILLMNLFAAHHDITLLSPYLFVIFCFLITAWVYSINYISTVLEKQKRASNNGASFVQT